VIMQAFNSKNLCPSLLLVSVTIATAINAAAPRKLVLAVATAHVKAHQHYVSPDGLYYVDLYPIAKNQSDVDLGVYENNQAHKLAGTWYHTTASLWLPGHGHTLIGSGDYDSGPDEIAVGQEGHRAKDEYRLDPDFIPEFHAKLGEQILYAASADGKTIIYGISESGNQKEMLHRHFLKMPGRFNGKA